MVPLDLDRIFPMNDAPSAAFMMLKAACLHEAGIITRSDKDRVDARASAIFIRTRTPSDYALALSDRDVAACMTGAKVVGAAATGLAPVSVAGVSA